MAAKQVQKDLGACVCIYLLSLRTGYKKESLRRNEQRVKKQDT